VIGAVALIAWPLISLIARPLAKSLIKGRLIAYQQAEQLYAGAVEGVGDLVSEPNRKSVRRHRRRARARGAFRAPLDDRAFSLARRRVTGCAARGSGFSLLRLAVPCQLPSAEHCWGDSSSRQPLIALSKLYDRLTCGGIGQLPSYLARLFGAVEPVESIINK
jgi:hypothetical protein